MAGLTVSEKEHWKERIAKQIDAKIEQIKASNPDVFDRIKREAYAAALNSLGLTKIAADFEALDKEAKAVAAKQKRLLKESVAAFRGIPVSEVTDNDCHTGYGNNSHFPNLVREAIDKRCAAHTAVLSRESDAGGRVAALEKEKDALIDTVWLATSPAQIKLLWDKVVSQLGNEQTPLQREAMDIKPVED